MRQPIRITFLAKRALYAKGGLAKKNREQACASMASMVSETRFALLERTKKLVTPTEEIVGGGCWESARRCWEWGGGRPGMEIATKFQDRSLFQLAKKINQQASPECWGHSCNVKLKDQAHLQGECRGLGR